MNSGQENSQPGTLSDKDVVLIAEDDPVFQRILKSWFERWDYRVISAENGSGAWNILQQENAPKLLVLDWMMPGMDGLEVCRKLRSLQDPTYRYILLLTARDGKQDVVAGLEAGADDYLTKPFHVEELRARVRTGKRILQLQEALLQAQEALRYEAAHDPLTGLWNRAAILRALKNEVSRALRTRQPLGVIMADLDEFKRVNDSYGHLAGDAVLREVGHRLAAALRNYDSVGRYGGEEFLILVPGCDSRDLAANAERLRVCVAERQIETCAGAISVSMSLGLAPLSAQSANPDYELLLRAADEALYAAKRHGRNRVETATVLDSLAGA